MRDCSVLITWEFLVRGAGSDTFHFLQGVLNHEQFFSNPLDVVHDLPDCFGGKLTLAAGKETKNKYPPRMEARIKGLFGLPGKRTNR